MRLYGLRGLRASRSAGEETRSFTVPTTSGSTDRCGSACGPDVGYGQRSQGHRDDAGAGRDEHVALSVRGGQRAASSWPNGTAASEPRT